LMEMFGLATVVAVYSGARFVYWAFLKE